MSGEPLAKALSQGWSLKRQGGKTDFQARRDQTAANIIAAQ